MFSRFVLALLAASSLACAGNVAPRSREAPQHAQRRAGAPFVVATFNVNFAIPDDPSTIDAVQRLDADVILLQETNEAWERSLAPWVLARGLHARYWRSSRWPAGGAGVLSRWPIRDERSVDSAVDWFQAHRFIVDAERGAVELVNVHLQPPVSDGSVVRGWFDAPAQHEREIARVFERLVTGRERALIVAGDFNEPEDRGAVAWLARERAMCSALPGFAPDATTWRWSVGPVELTQRLDHVVYSPRALRATEARVLALGRSDHLPVRVVFEWRR